MTRIVAFLRAINVGGHYVKMPVLKQAFEDLGLTYVETFIASGNVIFESSAANFDSLEQQIEEHLNTVLGFPVVTFLRTVEEVAALAQYQPFPDVTQDETTALSVAFLKAPPGDAARQKLFALKTTVDDFDIHGREVYWLVQSQYGETNFSGAVLEKALGVPATMRNITTVRRIAGKFHHPPAA